MGQLRPGHGIQVAGRVAWEGGGGGLTVRHSEAVTVHHAAFYRHASCPAPNHSKQDKDDTNKQAVPLWRVSTADAPAAAARKTANTTVMPGNSIPLWWVTALGGLALLSHATQRM